VGYRLYREVRDQAPDDWTPTERLVAWAIADDAGEDTRKSWIKLPELMRRTGIKTESGVRQALQRLAARGYEFRVPIKIGSDGRCVFATKGHSLDYRVPPMPQRQLSTVAFGDGADDEGSRESREESPPDEPKATVTDAKGDCAQSPLSSTPLLNDQNQKMAPRRAATSGLGEISGSEAIIAEVRRAAVTVYGERAEWLTDAKCAAMHRRFCCQPDGTPNGIKVSLHAYLAGKNGALRKVPTPEQALQPPARRRGKIPFDVHLRWDDPDTGDDERVEIVEELSGSFGPGAEPAVSSMIMAGNPWSTSSASSSRPTSRSSTPHESHGPALGTSSHHEY
jgi:hypothetical protein